MLRGGSERDASIGAFGMTEPVALKYRAFIWYSHVDGLAPQSKTPLPNTCHFEA